MTLPVCTLSPFCSSDIVTDLPFSSLTVDVDGKHPSSPPESPPKQSQPQSYLHPQWQHPDLSGEFEHEPQYPSNLHLPPF